MTFQDLDNELLVWARRHGLHVTTRDRENNEVRVVAIVDDAGCEYQVWLEPSPAGHVDIGAWDFRRRKKRIRTDAAGFSQALESVYAAIEEWIHHDGHTRTPVL